jgi:hypothetical protein
MLMLRLDLSKNLNKLLTQAGLALWAVKKYLWIACVYSQYFQTNLLRQRKIAAHKMTTKHLITN